MTKQQANNRRALIAELVELYLFCGYSISDLMGRPLDYFDIQSVQKTIETLKKEKVLIEVGTKK